jgi:hypothetical protein
LNLKGLEECVPVRIHSKGLSSSVKPHETDQLKGNEPERKTDAALLFLVYPLRVVTDERMKQFIVSLVGGRCAETGATG